MALPLAAMLVAVAGGSLLVLPLLGFIGVAILVGGFLFSVVIGLHYLLWGRWVERVIRQEREFDDEV